METSINSRISQVMEHEKLNVNNFAKAINKSYTAIYSIVKGGGKPGFDLLEAILANYPEINPNWLLMGKGEMFLQVVPAPAPAVGVDTYLVEHLHTLEENFARLAAQLEAKDKQLEAAIETSRGLQRTVDVLLSRPVTPSANFLNDVAARRSVFRLHPSTQLIVEPTEALA